MRGARKLDLEPIPAANIGWIREKGVLRTIWANRIQGKKGLPTGGSFRTQKNRFQTGEGSFCGPVQASHIERNASKSSAKLPNLDPCDRAVASSAASSVTCIPIRK